MRIAMTGASGSGKTTLAKYIEEKFPKLKFLSNSAYDVITPQDRVYLGEKFGYTASGQKNVVRLSHNDPQFGLEFQRFLLKNRIELFKNNDNFITDRSFIDNAAYFLDQCTPYQPDDATVEFLADVIEALNGIDLVIRIKMTQTFEVGVENNGSRINNWFYQKKIDKVFDLATELVGNQNTIWPTPRILVLDKWDLDDRKRKVFTTINELYESKKTSH